MTETLWIPDWHGGEEVFEVDCPRCHNDFDVETPLKAGDVYDPPCCHVPFVVSDANTNRMVRRADGSVTWPPLETKP